MNHLRVAFIFTIVSVTLILSACYTLTQTPSPAEFLMVTPAQTSPPCEACDQATLASALTLEKNNAENQAAFTAEIVRANAQATLDSANATLGAAQTQDQNNANAIAAQIAATAEIVRANAQATMDSAGSTQSAAITQDAIRQTQMSDLATTGAQSLLIQQNKDAIAASTQTAVANNIATQTQAGAATSQWYTDQTRQREEQRQVPIALIWMWCPPLFVLLFAGLVLWGIWRWLKIKQANQRILVNPVDQLRAPVTGEVIYHHHDDDSLPYIESDVADMDNRTQRIKPDYYQMRRWLDEVKRKLLRSDEKDNGNDTDN